MRGIFFFLALSCSLFLQGQINFKKTTFGIHALQFIPDNILGNPLKVDENPDGFVIETRNVQSGGFGMGIKREFSGLLGFELGLLVANKKFEVKILNEDSNYVNTLNLKWLNFHVPIKARIRLKVVEKLDVYGVFGGSFVVLPTDLFAATEDFTLRVFRKSWLKTALEGGMGLTYYLGNGNHLEVEVGTHQPFDRLGVGLFLPDTWRPQRLVNDFISSLGYFRFSFYFHEDSERIRRK